jgi:Na+/H+-translocating membrane pyrophosphatase
MSGAIVPLCYFLPETFSIGDTFDAKLGIAILDSSRWKAYSCVMCGLWSGLIIGWITEVYTSNAYSPV